MARKARIHNAGIVQHVMARGIKGRTLFSDDTDRTTLPAVWRSAKFAKEAMGKWGISDIV